MSYSENNMNSRSSTESTRTFHQKDSISKDDTNDDTYNDLENDAFEAQSIQPRRHGSNKEYIELTTINTFDEAEKYLKDNFKDYAKR